MLSHFKLPVLAIIFGLCIPLALAPFNFWPLIFIGLMGFFWLNQQVQTSKEAALVGWYYGVGVFGLGVSWVFGSMTTVGTSIPLSILLTAAFCLALAFLHSIQMWLFHRYLKALPFNNLLIAPLWWLIFEWVREWLFTGMPWLFAGYALIDSAIAQTSAVVGIYGLSLLISLTSAWFLVGYVDWSKTKSKSALLWPALAVVLLVLFEVGGLVKPADSWTTPLRTIKVVAIQSNISQEEKWSGAQQQPTLRFYGDMITKHTDVDLMVWPEAAMTRRPDQIPSYMTQVQSIAESRDQAIVTGVILKEDGRYFNGLLGYGTASGQYKKQHLVPFGEYLPLDKYLRGVIALFDIPMSMMVPAEVEQEPMLFTLAEQPYFMAPIICYEAAYPDLVRKLARNSDILTVVSNDAWFGDSIAPHQHLQITRLRAIENGRDMIRSTQNGLSALITANGTMLLKSNQFEIAELEGELTLRSGHTPFQTYPAVTIPWLSLLVVIGYFIRNRAYPKGKKTT